MKINITKIHTGITKVKIKIWEHAINVINLKFLRNLDMRIKKHVGNVNLGLEHGY